MEAGASHDMLSLKAPLARGLTRLDRSLFRKTWNLTAASVLDNRNIAKYRRQLESSNDIFSFPRISPIREDLSASAPPGRRCLLLRPGIKAQESDTWGKVVRDGVQAKELHLDPYELQITYPDWSYYDVISSILPEEFDDDYPTGFNTCGHIAHLNLRDRFLPYKQVIAEVLLDKNPNIKTVINKIDTIGESEYRTFGYEVLAGPDDLKVEVRQADCVFAFDYSKVYWNSKLDTEHKRIVDLFRPGEVVCDLMAGIGPFAVPAGKKGVFVWANDKNPESFKYLQQAIKRNKVSNFVRPFNEDGREFICRAADLVREASNQGEEATFEVKNNGGSKKEPPEVRRLRIPPTISHFVMNLPGSAITFVHHFKGLYAGAEKLFTPHTSTKLPMIHVHCFSVKPEVESAGEDIRPRLVEELGSALEDGNLLIHNVRKVAPNKSMYCASFRLPPDVAFAPRSRS